MKKLCFIDTETTGTDPQKHGLIQLAGFIVIDGEEKETFNYRVQPFVGDAVEDSALAVNKTTRVEISTYSAPRTVYLDFASLLSKYVDKYDKRDKFFFIGYNTRFDADFVRAFFEKNGDGYFGSWFWFPPIDVMNLAAVELMEERESLQNFKLATVAYTLKIQANGELHDALTDIRLTQKLYNSLTSGE